MLGRLVLLCSEFNPKGLSRALHLRGAGCAGRLYQATGHSPVMLCQLLGTGSRHGSIRARGGWGLEFCRSLLLQLVSACSVSRDLLIEQMSVLTEGPSSANNAES